MKVQTRPPATPHCFAGLVKMRNVEPIIILRGALKVYRRSPSPSRLTTPRGIAIFDKKTGCGSTRWALISQDCGYELTRGLVQQLRAATASFGVANSTKFRRHSSGSAVISSRDETFVPVEYNFRYLRQLAGFIVMIKILGIIKSNYNY